MEETPSIKNTDYWLKVVDMLQQNWAVIESTGAGVAVYFLMITEEYSTVSRLSSSRTLRPRCGGTVSRSTQKRDSISSPKPDTRAD